MHVLDILRVYRNMRINRTLRTARSPACALRIQLTAIVSASLQYMQVPLGSSCGFDGDCRSTSLSLLSTHSRRRAGH